VNCIVKIYRPDGSYLAAPFFIRHASEAGRCLDSALLRFTVESPDIALTDIRVEITFESTAPFGA
jgi:hypothetical protein